MSPDPAPWAAAFRGLARRAEDDSPLYAALATGIAEDPLLLALAARAPLDGRPAELLLAAVHCLLLLERGAPLLARYYADLAEPPLPPGEAFPAFRAFVEERAVEIAALMRSRSVRDEEIRRAAVLMPAFGLAARQGRPLQLVQLGSNAGLLLNWDRCGYDYGVAGRLHHPMAQITLTCAAQGPLPLPPVLPPTQVRVGLDAAPLDARRAADAAWLRALVWPERAAQRARLEAALRLAQLRPPRLEKGEPVARLHAAVAGLPRAGTAVVFHAFAMSRMTGADAAAIAATLHELARRRPIVQIGYEYDDGGSPCLALQDHGADTEPVRLARAAADGSSLTWLAD